MSFLEVNEVTKQYGEKVALHHISLELQKNEILGVVGHNGAGKTTLFKVMLGMYAPDQGEIKFTEKNFHLKNDIGYLPEQRGLYGKTDVFSQLLAFGYLKGISKTELKTTIDFWMEFFKIEESKNEFLANLSKGNQQKVQFIAAVIHKPKLLILDEPFSGLDPINVDMFMDAIHLLKENGSTIIYSSHKLDSIEHLSNRLLFLKDGSKVHLDDIENIQKQYGYKLKIKNDSLTEKMLLEQGFQFNVSNGIFEIELKDKKAAEYISTLLTNPFSELYLVEQRSIEEIFKLINREGDPNE